MIPDRPCAHLPDAFGKKQGGSQLQVFIVPTGLEKRQNSRIRSDYIEMFYNPTRKHVRNGMLSPVEFEKRHQI